MSVSRVFNLVRNGVAVGNVMLAAEEVEVINGHIWLRLPDETIAKLHVIPGVTLQEITQPEGARD